MLNSVAKARINSQDWKQTKTCDEGWSPEDVCGGRGAQSAYLACVALDHSSTEAELSGTPVIPHPPGSSSSTQWMWNQPGLHETLNEQTKTSRTSYISSFLVPVPPLRHEPLHGDDHNSHFLYLKKNQILKCRRNDRNKTTTFSLEITYWSNTVQSMHALHERLRKKGWRGGW